VGATSARYLSPNALVFSPNAPLRLKHLDPGHEPGGERPLEASTSGRKFGHGIRGTVEQQRTRTTTEVGCLNKVARSCQEFLEFSAEVPGVFRGRAHRTVGRGETTRRGIFFFCAQPWRAVWPGGLMVKTL